MPKKKRQTKTWSIDEKLRGVAEAARLALSRAGTSRLAYRSAHAALWLASACSRSVPAAPLEDAAPPAALAPTRAASDDARAAHRIHVRLVKRTRTTAAGEPMSVLELSEEGEIRLEKASMGCGPWLGTLQDTELRALSDRFDSLGLWTFPEAPDNPDFDGTYAKLEITVDGRSRRIEGNVRDERIRLIVDAIEQGLHRTELRAVRDCPQDECRCESGDSACSCVGHSPSAARPASTPPATTTAIREPHGSCTTDGDCSRGEQCAIGRCIGSAPADVPRPQPSRTSSPPQGPWRDGPCEKLSKGSCRNEACPAGFVCSGIPAYTCFNGRCAMPKCLPGAVRISTPSGDRPISALVEGDVVFTLTADCRRAVAKVERVTRTAVPPEHRMVVMRLDDGREVRASPLHPMLDGRPMAAATAGDGYAGARVSGIRTVPFEGEYAHDLLPTGETGTYWADGVPLRSTLAADPERWPVKCR